MSVYLRGTEILESFQFWVQQRISNKIFDLKVFGYEFFTKQKNVLENVKSWIYKGLNLKQIILF